MKTIYFIIPLCVLSFNHLFGRIMNGYEPQIERSKIALQELKAFLSENKHLSLGERLQVKEDIENLTSCISYYEITEALIRQLRVISPGIFVETDNLKDKRGRPTDVYVKLIPKEAARILLEAATFFAQAPADEDLNHSAYGDYSVSVEIWISNNALFLLSHELGHIKYIVPNLATYAKFYNKHYAKVRVNLGHIGHFPFDQSGKYARGFEKRFLEDEKTYLQKGGKKPQTFFSLLTRIRKTIRNSENIPLDEALASNHTF